MAFPIAPSSSPGTAAPQQSEREPISREMRVEMEIRVDALLATLEKDAEQRVIARRPIEQRMIANSYQYAGRYLHHEEKAIKDGATWHRSQIYMNETAHKSDAMEDRLVDIQFPADDRNFSIEPTAVPELSDEATAFARFAAENQQALLQIPEGDPAAQEAMAAQRMALERATTMQAEMDEARRRSAGMQDEMDDQLQECGYAVQCKLVSHDACMLGTGVIKGPVLSSERKQVWRQSVDDASGFTVHEMAQVEKPRPAYYRVDPFNFFPCMDACHVGESDSFFERHLLTPSQLRKLAKTPGFIKDNIRKLLKMKPQDHVPTYISELRGISGNDTTGYENDRYHMWEYHGPIEPEDWGGLQLVWGDDSEGVTEDPDPLEEINVSVWFCQGVLLKFGIHPLDSGEPIYSVFNYKRDEHSIFGYGVPHLMAAQQQVISGAWRMMVDNAGLATAPQIVFNPSVVEPYDGDYTIAPGKMWLKKSGTAPGDRPFETYHLDMRQTEQAAIIQMALQSIDRSVGVPNIAESDPGVVPKQTALGISLFSNEQKIPFRALVKHFDDNITIPNMRRLYDWNMQFSDKEHIKGDARIKARGTSTFMLRELQAPALMTMLLQFASHPILGPAIQFMPALRRLAQAMMLPSNEIVKSDEKMAADLAAAARDQEPEPSPEQIKLQVAEMNYNAAVQQATINAESRKYDIDRQYEIELIRQETAANKNLDNNDLRREVEEKKLEQKDRVMAADIGMAERTGQKSGGYV